VTAEAGLLLPRELDERLGLGTPIERHISPSIQPWEWRCATQALTSAGRNDLGAGIDFDPSGTQEAPWRRRAVGIGYGDVVSFIRPAGRQSWPGGGFAGKPGATALLAQVGLDHLDDRSRSRRGPRVAGVMSAPSCSSIAPAHRAAALNGALRPSMPPRPLHVTAAHQPREPMPLLAAEHHSAGWWGCAGYSGVPQGI